MEGTGNLSLSRNVGKSGNVDFQAKKGGYRSTPKNKCLKLYYMPLIYSTNISIFFEFSKYNSLIFNWFRK